MKPGFRLTTKGQAFDSSWHIAIRVIGSIDSSLVHSHVSCKNHHYSNRKTLAELNLENKTFLRQTLTTNSEFFLSIQFRVLKLHRKHTESSRLSLSWLDQSTKVRGSWEKEKWSSIQQRSANGEELNFSLQQAQKDDRNREREVWPKSVAVEGTRAQKCDDCSSEISRETKFSDERSANNVCIPLVANVSPSIRGENVSTSACASEALVSSRLANFDRSCNV